MIFVSFLSISSWNIKLISEKIINLEEEMFERKGSKVDSNATSVSDNRLDANDV